MDTSTYHFVIENVTDEIKTATLFGQNLFLLIHNHGSNVGITIEPFDKNKDYAELLHRSALFPFKPKLLRFSVDSSSKMPKEMIYYTRREEGNDNLFGEYKKYNINLITHKDTIHKWGDKIIHDIKIDKYNEKDEVNISGHEYFTIEMQPKSKIELIVF